MEDYSDLAEEMCRQIRWHSSNAQQYAPLAVVNEKVLAIMATVPRHKFVQFFPIEQAYLDTPMGIGYGQTISQPYIVALMTSLLAPEPDDRVLEIGTGSGYQAAVLAEMVATVYSIEAIPDLAKQAAAQFAALDYKNIITDARNGAAGWPEYAPYDGIIVTAACRSIPHALIDQLNPGGRLVLPLEDPQDGRQDLQLITKQANGDIARIGILPVRFVPFI